MGTDVHTAVQRALVPKKVTVELKRGQKRAPPKLDVQPLGGTHAG